MQNQADPTLNRRCVLYARVSTEEQIERFGLSSQLSELRSYAAKASYQVSHELVDDGYSGGDLGRPALVALRDLVRQRAVSLILVHDPDRLARKLAHQLILTEEFEKAGVRLEFVTTPAADNMEGRLLLNVRGVIAEYEREKIRERTMRGRREKARQNLFVGGRRTFGYCCDSGVVQINDVEAAVVRQIFVWLVEDGLSIRLIIEKLNKGGFKPHTSTHWAKSTVSRLLRNQTYTGRAFYNRRQRFEPEGRETDLRRNKKTSHKWRAASEWIEQTVPAIISIELFTAAQLKLKQNSAHCSGRPPKNIYLLRGILKCPLCGCKCVGTPIFGDKYYRCRNNERLAVPRCSGAPIAANTIESFVWNYVVQLLLNPELLTAKMTEQSPDDSKTENELERIDKQIRDVQRKETRLLEVMLDGQISLHGMRAKATELALQRAALERTAQELQAQLVMKHDRVRLRATVLLYCQALADRLPSLDLPARQKLLRALLDDVVVNDGRVTLRGILPSSGALGNSSQRQHVVVAGGGDF